MELLGQGSDPLKKLCAGTPGLQPCMSMFNVYSNNHGVKKGLWLFLPFLIKLYKNNSKHENIIVNPAATKQSCQVHYLLMARNIPCSFIFLFL